MTRMIFVNLPVADLDRSVGFWTELGFAFNPQFSDDKAACMVVSDLACVMLLTEKYFSTFTPKDVADATALTETINAFSAESREEVDRLTELALANGGTETRAPQEDDFMYGRSFADPDGHVWELIYMDPAALEEQA